MHTATQLHFRSLGDCPYAHFYSSSRGPAKVKNFPRPRSVFFETKQKQAQQPNRIEGGEAESAQLK
jgi:hypothetical protein